MLNVILLVIHNVTVGWTIFISTLIVLVGLIFNIRKNEGWFTKYTYISIIAAGIVLFTIPFDELFIREVPTVTQVNYIFAKEELNKIGLSVETNINDPDETYWVIDQDKKTGQLVLKGSTVKLELEGTESILKKLADQGVAFTDMAFAFKNLKMTITDYNEETHETKELGSLGYPIYDYSGIEVHLTRHADDNANSFTFVPEFEFIENYNNLSKSNVVVKNVPFGTYDVSIKLDGFEDRNSKGLIIEDRVRVDGNNVPFFMIEKNASTFAPMNIILYGDILNEFRDIYYSISLKDLKSDGIGNELLKSNHEIEIRSYSHTQFMLSLILGDKEIYGSDYFSIEHAGDDIYLYVTNDTITQTNFESYLNYTAAR